MRGSAGSTFSAKLRAGMDFENILDMVSMRDCPTKPKIIIRDCPTFNSSFCRFCYAHCLCEFRIVQLHHKGSSDNIGIVRHLSHFSNCMIYHIFTYLHVPSRRVKSIKYKISGSDPLWTCQNFGPISSLS